MSIQKKQYLACLLSIIIVQLFFHLKLSAQNAGVELGIELPRSQYLLDEWLTANVTFKNTGNNTVKIVHHLEPEYGFLKFTIQDDFGNKIGYNPWTLSLVGLGPNATTIDILPQKSYSAVIDLSYMMQGGNRVTTCFKPGTYQIQANYRLSKTKDEDLPFTSIDVNSKWISYQVIEPSGEDAKAYTLLLKNHEESPWYVSKEHRNTYDRLLNLYPNSVYAQYALFYQALSIEVAAKRRTMESTNKYKQVLDNYPDFPLKYMLREQLMASYLELGEIDKAQLIIDEIKSTAEDDYSKFKTERELRPSIERFRLKKKK